MFFFVKCEHDKNKILKIQKNDHLKIKDIYFIISLLYPLWIAARQCGWGSNCCPCYILVGVATYAIIITRDSCTGRYC